MKTYQRHQSSIGEIAANIVSVLCYLSVLLFWGFGLVVPLLIFLFEKKSGLVRFHSMQAMLMWLLRCMFGGDIAFEGLAALVTGDALYLLNPLGWAGELATIIVRLVVTALVVVCVVAAGVSAYYWREWKVPLLGQLATFICGKSRQAAYNAEGPVPEDCKIQVPEPRREAAPPAPPPKKKARPAKLRPPLKAAPEPPLPVDDANRQLPPGMRDGASLAEWASPPKAAPAPASAVPVVPAAPAVNASKDTAELYKTMDIPPIHTVPLYDESSAQAPAPAPEKQPKKNGNRLGLHLNSKNGTALPLPVDDPNRNLPPEMRDPPLPPDML